MMECEFHPKWEGSRAEAQERLRFLHNYSKWYRAYNKEPNKFITQLKWEFRRKLIKEGK
jgi:hypothetical protein